MELFIDAISAALRSTVPHLRRDMPEYQLHELSCLPPIDDDAHLLLDSVTVGLPALGPVAFNWTQTMSKWSDRIRYWQDLGRSSCWRVLLHLPIGRNLHFSLAGSLCSLQPEDASNSAEAVFTKLNSSMVVTAGFRSSA